MDEILFDPPLKAIRKFNKLPSSSLIQIPPTISLELQQAVTSIMVIRIDFHESICESYSLSSIF